MFSVRFLWGIANFSLICILIPCVYQISNVVQEARALDINSHIIYPLGETAAAIRGENELWFAMVLRNKLLCDLKPPQLASVCGSLVSEGIKVRPWKNNR